MSVRVRFAPSPTGALHIGGIRTALYNYLFARQQGGQFLLRIEDTDQGRYVTGAEAYIIEALAWCGLIPDEGPEQGGPVGPYRQSERKAIYAEYAQKLIANGAAYYAFDTPEELEAMRVRLQAEGVHSPTYDATTRNTMRNSLTLSSEEVNSLLQNNTPYVIRLWVQPDQEVTFTDEIRGDISFRTSDLDDKVLMKGDGMPTYHLANVVDDYLMKITHVIRGEEWLSSTPHHVLLYKGLGIEQTPTFAHLPLILKPNGKGKLSKRDGKQLGIPVFPLSWDDPDPENQFDGFREKGFDPRAVVNFLAFLGWSPGTDQELFSLDQLIEAFSFRQVSKGGARFDYEKALWFNQQYIKQYSGEDLSNALKPWLPDTHAQGRSDQYLEQAAVLMRERVHLLPEILTVGYYLFSDELDYDTAAIEKRVKPEGTAFLQNVFPSLIENLDSWDRNLLEAAIKESIASAGLGLGAVMPVLRLAIAGTLQGPDLIDMMILLGKESVTLRISKFLEIIPNR
jgi:glutamyl-tRNA synthetase